MLIMSILNNFVKEKDPYGINPRCEALHHLPSPLGEEG
jgi:hypothetical protein